MRIVRRQELTCVLLVFGGFAWEMVDGTDALLGLCARMAAEYGLADVSQACSDKYVRLTLFTRTYIQRAHQDGSFVKHEWLGY